MNGRHTQEANTITAQNLHPPTIPDIYEDTAYMEQEDSGYLDPVCCHPGSPSNAMNTINATQRTNGENETSHVNNTKREDLSGPVVVHVVGLETLLSSVNSPVGEWRVNLTVPGQNHTTLPNKPAVPNKPHAPNKPPVSNKPPVPKKATVPKKPPVRQKPLVPHMKPAPHKTPIKNETSERYANYPIETEAGGILHHEIPELSHSLPGSPRSPGYVDILWEHNGNNSTGNQHHHYEAMA